MKKFLSISIFMLFAAIVSVRAGDIVSPLKGQPESWYDVVQTTVSISSSTVLSDTSVSGYRAVYIYNLSATATVYYTLSTSTQNVTVIGWPIFPNKSTTGYTQPEKIEYNGQINYLLGAGSAAITVNKKTVRK